MKRENVDGAALDEHRERDLDRDLPAQGDEHRNDRLDQPSVCLIEETVELLPAPTHRHVKARIERCNDPGERVHRQGAQSPTLDVRDRSVRQASADTQVRLSPPASDAKGAN